MQMIILAAGRGTRLRPLTDSSPKCLIELGGRSLLDWQLEAAEKVGIPEVVVVGGHLAERLQRPGLRLVINQDYDSTNMVYSLFCAESSFGRGFVLSYGDVVYDVSVLQALLANHAPIAVVVDRNWLDYWRLRFTDPLSDAESLRMDETGRIRSIGQPEKDVTHIDGQYIGLVAFRESGVDALRQTYATALRDEEAGRLPFNGSRPLRNLFVTDLLQGMIDLGHSVISVPVAGGWLEIDSLHDLQLASRLVKNGRIKR